MVIDLLKDKDLWVRVKAAKVLGEFGPNAQDAVPSLVCLLTDEDGQVRQAATNALKRIAPEAVAKAGVQ